MVGRWASSERLGIRTVITLVTTAIVASSCAAPRRPAPYLAVAEAERTTCEDFARAEVKRLGESVPAAFAKGFFIGLALDVSWALESVHVHRGAIPADPFPDEPVLSTGPPRGTVPLASWAIGGAQLA